MLGLKSFRSAAIALAGVELAHRIRNGQHLLPLEHGRRASSLKNLWDRALSQVGTPVTDFRRQLRGDAAQYVRPFHRALSRSRAGGSERRSEPMRLSRRTCRSNRYADCRTQTWCCEWITGIIGCRMMPSQSGCEIRNSRIDVTVCIGRHADPRAVVSAKASYRVLVEAVRVRSRPSKSRFPSGIPRVRRMSYAVTAWK